MTRPKTSFEAASYDLVKFRERRMAERRSAPRGTADRRTTPPGDGAGTQPEDHHASSGDNRDD